MRIVRLPSDLRDLQRPLAFVPTMGALHEGHLELIRQARKVGRTVVASIFVNPTQFAPGEDFARYPRDLDRDAALAESVGADVVYAPSVETMYSAGPTTKVVVGEASVNYEGASRPGHFDGVATVVLKLFNQARPDIALFGRKDLQQCAVIRRMVDDLDVPVALEFVPTFREPDGLAMSSRNVYLSPEERLIAPRLHEALGRVASAAREGRVKRALGEERAVLEGAGFRVDYLDLVSSSTFASQAAPDSESAIVVAARLGNTRLIDNIELR